MPPVVLTPHEGDAWKISGGFDLEATLDEQSAVHEVGGTDYRAMRERIWRSRWSSSSPWRKASVSRRHQFGREPG